MVPQVAAALGPGGPLLLLLAAARSLANFVNHGSYFGRAAGFKLSALVRLADTKSPTDRLGRPPRPATLAHALCRLAVAARPGCLGPALAALAPCAEAAVYPMKQLRTVPFQGRACEVMAVLS
jgi:hypothetical protein